jgi:nitrite reductase/ring-hydroxylating ferredoxin subunit
MPSVTRVAACADIPEGEIRQVQLGERQIALYHLPGGEFRATDDLCTHGQAFLSEGWLTDEGHVECPLHGGCFDTRTGEPTMAPCEIPIRTYEVRIDGEDIFLVEN